MPDCRDIIFLIQITDVEIRFRPVTEIPDVVDSYLIMSQELRIGRTCAGRIPVAIIGRRPQKKLDQEDQHQSERCGKQVFLPEETCRRCKNDEKKDCRNAQGIRQSQVINGSSRPEC